MQGFTILEMLIVIVVVGVLASLTFNAVGDSRARGRDAERATDIDTLHSRLEEYYSDNGGYPNTFTVATFGGLDPEALQDPSGNSITIVPPVTSQTAAQATANPTGTGPNYKYIPYPTGCNAINCLGYVLKSYIEKPTPEVPNPYIRTGLHNN